MPLTRAGLIACLQDELGASASECKEIVDSFFATIVETLEQGEEVKLSGFGNFILRDKHERPGRNPQTGEKATISARRVVTFHAGQKLKASLDSSS